MKRLIIAALSLGSLAFLGANAQAGARSAALLPTGDLSRSLANVDYRPESTQLAYGGCGYGRGYYRGYGRGYYGGHHYRHRSYYAPRHHHHHHYRPYRPHHHHGHYGGGGFGFHINF